MKIEGVWLPVITPFLNGSVDYSSYENLVNFYIARNVSGIIPLATTGEGPTIGDDEFIKIVELTIRIVNGRIPVYFGVGGNYTEKVISSLKLLHNYNFDGILSVSPYYNRPSQEGIYEHFKKISESTDKNIIIYNIPYRTGRNIENETIFRLSELKNIIGIKDSCGDIKQSAELIFNKPEGFSVLTGEDLLFYITVAMGGDGGILAAAHIETEKYLNIYSLIKNNNLDEARRNWKDLLDIIPLLFEEPNPRPIKYILKNKNLITSDETRLPITDISDKLKKQLGRFF
ncbi:MAG: 4-hydroxy-tetrahydrodipicolinate synthase [Brevinematales bacterium]|jgi:4-hydroxy-tetrahydrodipicolinate synthase